MSKRVAAATVGLTAVLLLGGCLTTERSEEQGRFSRALSTQAALPARIGIVPAAPPDSFLTFVGSRSVLPKWKTNWEREAERKMKAVKATGKINADTFDTYRSTNINKFFVTTAPTTAVRIPAEFEPSQGYLVAWTTGLGATRDKIYAEMIKGVWGKVPAIMAHTDAAHKTTISSALTAAGIPAADLTDTTKIVWWQHALDSIWVRDFGPVSITDVPAAGNPKLSFVDFRYYHTRTHDDEIPADLATAWGINDFRPDLDFEGGNLMSTADGLCAASKGVLWLNTQFSQSAVEDLFKKFLGCKKMIFPAPLNGESTTHIDMFAKYGSNTTVMVGEYTTAQDATNKTILDQNAVLFAATTNGAGGTVVVTRIPMPNKGGTAGNPTWRTYTNAVSLASTTTKTVIIPVYSDETSQETAALAAVAKVFPGWTQVAVDSKDIIDWGGAIHCIVMQIPVGDKAKMETDPGEACTPKKVACAFTGCGNITDAGCCEGELLKYCDAGKVVAEDCATNPKCGFDGANGWYGCGTAGGADTSGKLPRNCGVLTDAAVPDLPPNKCGAVTFEGCCSGQRLYFCENNAVVGNDCTAGPSCGWNASGGYYDCQTNGAADPSGMSPMACNFGDGGPPPIPDGGPKPDVPPVLPCGVIVAEGCCDGEKVKYCDGGTLTILDCTTNTTGNKCSWDAAVGYDCGTSGVADPSGKFPKACPATTSDQSVPQQDKGTTPPSDQRAITRDAGSATKKDTGSTTKPGPGGGCSCAMTAQESAASAPSFLLGLAALIFVRRRRRR